jgi:hypothetical protein
MHEWGLAFDIKLAGLDGPTQKAVLNAVGPFWEQIGGRWGGRFKDEIHFEAPAEIKKRAGWKKGAVFTAARGVLQGIPDDPLFRSMGGL